MAATSDDILTVEQVRQELRIPDGATSTTTADLTPVSGTNPLVFDAPGLRSVTEVRYWTVLSGNLRAGPDGVIDGADLGDSTVSGSQAVLQSPSGGWPDVLAGSSMRIEFIVGAQDALIQDQIDAVLESLRLESNRTLKSYRGRPKAARIAGAEKIGADSKGT